MKKRNVVHEYILAPLERTVGLPCFKLSGNYVPSSFCIKRLCEVYNKSTNSCDLAPQDSEKEARHRKGRLSFEKPHGTLRMNRGSGQGWHYRKM